MAKPLPLSEIDALLTAGRLETLSDDALRDVAYSVEFAFNPLAVSGHEAHRCDVDRCGLSEDRLRKIETAAWTELAVRNDRTHDLAA